MKTIAIITARGCSKRIPKKNIKMFCGKPIISYSITTALNSGIFDTVMVSTDDKEIAKISKFYGAEVPFLRSEKTSNDFATTADVINEVIKDYKSLGRTFDVIFCLYPTAPFITDKRLIETFSILKENVYNCVLPVVRFSYPPQRSMIIENNYLKFKYLENINKRSQDLESLYHDCGQFYAIKTEDFILNNNLITDKTFPLILSELEVQDIDTMEDWEIAEIKYKIINETKNK